MSHGGGSGEQSSEPNLTPLLDMVLQLVMFFMLVANFVNEEFSGKIALPSASQAKPLTNKDTNFTYLNVNKTGHVLVMDREPLVDQNDVVTYMRRFASTHKLGDKVYEKVTVIIRADKESKFRDVHKVMAGVKLAGFKNLQLRAEIAQSK